VISFNELEVFNHFTLKHSTGETSIRLLAGSTSIGGFLCSWQALLWKNSSQPSQCLRRKWSRMVVGLKDQHCCHLFGVYCLW